jgi:hypothetical protein
VKLSINIDFSHEIAVFDERSLNFECSIFSAIWSWLFMTLELCHYHDKGGLPWRTIIDQQAGMPEEIIRQAKQQAMAEKHRLFGNGVIPSDLPQQFIKITSLLHNVKVDAKPDYDAIMQQLLDYRRECEQSLQWKQLTSLERSLPTLLDIGIKSRGEASKLCEAHDASIHLHHHSTAQGRKSDMAQVISEVAQKRLAKYIAKQNAAFGITNPDDDCRIMPSSSQQSQHYHELDANISSRRDSDAYGYQDEQQQSAYTHSMTPASAFSHPAAPVDMSHLDRIFNSVNSKNHLSASANDYAN